jgi:hypothetical protein
MAVSTTTILMMLRSTGLNIKVTELVNIGHFSDDKKNGQGTLFFINGERFEGNFVDDSVEGSGVFHCRNGASVVGVWRGNLMVK